MKLRNKHTGLVGELHYEPDKEYHFTVATEDPADMTIHKTLAELNEEWEDYKPTEPLIKDEKIRKAVRAWADANRWTDDVKLEFNDFGYHDSWSLEQLADNNEIHFSKRVPNCYRKSLYTIAELCGEEE